MQSLYALATLLLFTAACGAKVVADTTDGTGGQGSTSTPPSTSSSTGTGISSSGSNASCAPACAELLKKNCVGDDCVTTCNAIAGAPACAKVASALLDCLTAHAPTVKGNSCFIPACAEERDAFQKCSAPGTCTDPLLSGFVPGGCVGHGTCASGSVSAQCSAQGDCDCISGDGTKQMCHETTPFLCDLVNGCCAAHL